MFSSPRYHAQLLLGARPEQHGVAYLDGSDSRMFSYQRISRAIAADVGEPEGVRTIIFDLACELSGEHSVVYRFDAEPGEAAQQAARWLEEALGAERCTPALRELAKDGTTTRWYPDVESFEEANLEYC